MDNETRTSYLNMLLESGCKPVFSTNLFGKNYVWMKDKFGSIFLERTPDFEQLNLSE